MNMGFYLTHNEKRNVLRISSSLMEPNDLRTYILMLIFLVFEKNKIWISLVPKSKPDFFLSELVSVLIKFHAQSNQFSASPLKSGPGFIFPFA